MFATEAEYVSVLKRNRVLAQAFAADESAVFASQVLDERNAALQEKLGVASRNVIHLMRKFVGVARNGFLGPAYQEGIARNDNRFEPEIVALRNQRQSRRRAPAYSRAPVQMHPIREHSTEADLIAVTYS